MRAALRQQEYRLQEEGLRIQQLVEEFKFKQKTIGAPFEIQVLVYSHNFHRAAEGQGRFYARAKAAQRPERQAPC